MFKTTFVFDRNLEAYNNGYRYIINQGSARSSKTYSIIQLLYLIAYHSKKPRIISIVSKTLPHLKRGAFRDFTNILIRAGIYDDKLLNKSSLIYTINKSMMEFFSVDQPDKVYGAARDILFVNEISSIEEEIFRQLVIRTSETIFVDYNPIREFYIHTDYIGRKDAYYIHSTFFDNPYLNKEIAKELIETGKRNKNFQRVFVEGQIGELEGCIFDNWEIGLFDKSLSYIYGLDIGMRDPDACVKVAVDRDKKIIYVDEVLYKKGLSTNELYHALKARVDNKLVICDSAVPKTIKDLSSLGLNIEACIKNKVIDDIKIINSYKIIVTENSKNIISELKNYVWLDEKSETPIDDYNHAIDAMRYAFGRLVNYKVIRQQRLLI